MLVTEVGPGGLFDKIREASGIEEDAHGNKVALNDYTPLHCVCCTSVYTAAIVLLAPGWLKRLLALSAVAVLLDSYENKK